MADYFTQTKKMWDDYTSLITIPHCSCGFECASFKAANKLIQDQQLMQFLVGLKEDYKVARGNILMMKPLRNIDNSMILQEEKQRSLQNMSQISNILAAFNTFC